MALAACHQKGTVCSWLSLYSPLFCAQGSSWFTDEPVLEGEKKWTELSTLTRGKTMARTILFIGVFKECLVNTYYHPQPRDTKVKANLSLAFSLVGDKEN